MLPYSTLYSKYIGDYLNIFAVYKIQKNFPILDLLSPYHLIKQTSKLTYQREVLLYRISQDRFRFTLVVINSCGKLGIEGSMLGSL